MRACIRRVIGGSLCCVPLLAVALAASAEDVRAEPPAPAPRAALRAAYDLAVLRPLALAQLVVSAGFFAAALPVAVPSGNFAPVWEACIAQPAARALRRPLGAL